MTKNSYKFWLKAAGRGSLPIWKKEPSISVVICFAPGWDKMKSVVTNDTDCSSSVLATPRYFRSRR